MFSSDIQLKLFGNHKEIEKSSKKGPMRYFDKYIEIRNISSGVGYYFTMHNWQQLQFWSRDLYNAIVRHSRNSSKRPLVISPNALIGHHKVDDCVYRHLIVQSTNHLVFVDVVVNGDKKELELKYAVTLKYKRDQFDECAFTHYMCSYELEFVK